MIVQSWRFRSFGFGGFELEDVVDDQLEASRRRDESVFNSPPMLLTRMQGLKSIVQLVWPQQQMCSGDMWEKGNRETDDEIQIQSVLFDLSVGWYGGVECVV